MRRITWAHAFAPIIAASVAIVGLAACGTSTTPGGSSSTSQSPAGGSLTPNGSGSASAGSATASPAPATTLPVSPTGRTGPPGPPVTSRGILTVADSGTTIRLRSGQEVTVLLGPGGMMMWGRPAAVGSAVIRVSASGGYPSSLPARGVFRAVAPGTAHLTAATDAKCLHTTPRCMIPQRLWQVTVIVSPS